MLYYLGMDIGGTKCAVIICDEKNGTIIDKIRFNTDKDRGWKAVVDELISSNSHSLLVLQIGRKYFMIC